MKQKRGGRQASPLCFWVFGFWLLDASGRLWACLEMVLAVEGACLCSSGAYKIERRSISQAQRVLRRAPGSPDGVFFKKILNY